MCILTHYDILRFRTMWPSIRSDRFPLCSQICFQASSENEHLRRGHSVQRCSNRGKKWIKKIRRMSIMVLNEMNHLFIRHSVSHSNTTTCPLSSDNCLFVCLCSSRSVSGEKDFSVISHSDKMGLKILVTVKRSLFPADLPLMYDTLTRKRMSLKPIFIKN